MGLWGFDGLELVATTMKMPSLTVLLISLTIAATALRLRKKAVAYEALCISLLGLAGLASGLFAVWQYRVLVTTTEAADVATEDFSYEYQGMKLFVGFVVPWLNAYSIVIAAYQVGMLLVTRIMLRQKRTS